jgi:hypothetical protein
MRKYSFTLVLPDGEFNHEQLDFIDGKLNEFLFAVCDTIRCSVIFPKKEK